MKRAAAGFACISLLAGMPAAGYYHYVHYLSRNGPYVALPMKFDLSGLPNKTVTVLVSDSGPATLAPNDSLASVLSQIRQATLAWNAVETSDLRVAFGGLIQGNTVPKSPGVEVVFDELAPGFIAFTANDFGSPTAGPSGPFFPITRSILKFRRDLSADFAGSYTDRFFTTAVHEFGHTLGLQHSFTSSAMTVGVNRNINRSRPLDADDIAGLSLLYPKAGYQAAVGSIAGRVTYNNGQPVAMASVVALRPAGAAISSLTAPDGTYRIEGLPPDAYYVYVHPLPADADITPPLDANGQPTFPPSAQPFETVFYPGVRDVTQFAPINVGRGSTVGGINFNVAPRASVPVHQGSTYSYVDNVDISPAFVISNQGTGRFVFNSDAASATPVRAQVLGVGAVDITPWTPAVSVILDIKQWPLGAGTGPRHLLLTYANDLYVLPSALNLVSKRPPEGISIAPLPDGNVLVAGKYMGQDSRVFFDGLAATVRSPFTGSDAGGTVIVTPPPGFSGQRATVTVFNSDGQSSMQLQRQNSPVYTYEASAEPQIAVSQASLPAGSSALVEIVGLNTRFIDGQVTVGFGTHDVFVRRVWVLGPNRIVANVSVLPDAAPGLTEISVISGFQTVVQPFAFTTQQANPRLPSIVLPLVNAVPGQTNFFPGAAVTISGSNLGAAGTVSVSLTDAAGNTLPAAIAAAQPGSVTFIVPTAAAGVATLRLTNGADAAFPVAIQIDSQPPVIAAVSTSSGMLLDATRAVSAGEVLNLIVAGLDAGAIAAPSRLRVLASGIELPILQVTPASQPGFLQVQVVVTQSFGGQQAPITISENGTISNPFNIVIR